MSFDATFGLYTAHAALNYAETNGVITVSAMGMLTLPGPIVIAGGFTLQNGTVTDIKLSLASPSGLQTPVPGLTITSFSGDIRPTSNFSITAMVGLSYLNFPEGEVILSSRPRDRSRSRPTRWTLPEWSHSWAASSARGPWTSR